MKKFKNLLYLLLILPLCFVFISCKKDGDSGGDKGGNVTPPDNNPTVPTQTYSVSYDYNLPEGYDFILNDFTVSNIEVGKSTKLALVPDSKLSPYFLGWSREGSTEILTDDITSNSSTEIKLQGNWDEEKIKTYYYSDGFVFAVSGSEIAISSYDGLSETVIIPKYVTNDGVDYLVTEIYDSVFKDKNISKVVLNCDDVIIDNYAFYGTKISTFDFSKVSSIGENAFRKTALTSVKLSNTLVSVGKYAFADCENLTAFDFNDAGFDIPSGLFSGCTKLSLIQKADNLTSIGSYAFSNCSSLTNIDFIGDKVNYIYEYAFENCSNALTATIPEKVIHVYGHLFDGCDKLQALTISKLYVTSSNTGADKLLNHIGGTDSLGNSLKTITMVGNSTSRLPQNYFDGLAALETFVMCDSIMHVENYAFRECANLKDITLSNNISLDDFSYYAFYGTKFLNEMTEPFIYKDNIIYVPNNISAEYEIPANVVKICSSAFQGNSSLQKITISENVATIGSGAFADCANLTQVVFKDNSNLTKIESRLFYNCMKLESINLEKLSALTKIGDEAFYGVKISRFVMPASVTELGVSVFRQAKIAEIAISGSSEVFSTDNGVLYKTEGSEKTLVLYPLSKTGTLFVCPSDVTKVAAYAFADVKNLNIYFTNSSMVWEGSEDSHGETVYRSFFNAENISIFSEQQSFTTEEANVQNIYYLVSSKISYNQESNSISIDADFEMTHQYNFVKFQDSATGKICVAYFELKTNSENVVSVVENSLKVFETDLLS